MRPVMSVPLLSAAVLTAGAVALRLFRARAGGATIRQVLAPGSRTALPNAASLPDRLRAQGF
ncbi:MAG: hypothetical protein WD960_16235 [Gemmatimonadota bacterium]